MYSRIVILDANILIRAVLGNKVRNLLLTYHTEVDFLTPDICIDEARKYIPSLLNKKNAPIEPALKIFDKLTSLMQIIDFSVYQIHMNEAKERLKNRDLNDWPIIASALTFNCPIWTEDQDFFGSGISIWTTDRIHLYLKSKEEIVLN